MRLATFVLLTAAFVVLLAGSAEAHRQGLRPGYTRLLYDCSHDWGWESGHPEDLGHELVTLDLTEREEEGRPLVVFELNFVQAMSVLGQSAGYEMKETLSFNGPRGGFSTTLRTTTESEFTPIAGATPAYIGPRKAGLTGADWNASAEDPSLIAVDVGYTYEQLKLQNGEAVTGYRLVGHYQNAAGLWRAGDELAGGSWDVDGSYEPACKDGDHPPETDETWYVAPHYIAQQSDWIVPTPTNAAPTAAFDFTPTAPRAGDLVTFTDRTTDPDGNLATWAWAFGDGASSTTRSPTHSFAVAGSYTVTLLVSDSMGLEASTSRTIHVAQAVTNTPPAARFGVAPPEPRTFENVTFTDASSDAEGPIASWAWDLGDGSKATGANVTHQYHKPGVYVVGLNVTDASGAWNQTLRNVTVRNRLPVPDLSILPTLPRAGQPVAFVDRSEDEDGIIVSYSWDLGDGNRSQVASPTHTYRAPGTYSVVLEISDDAGGKSTMRKELRVDAESRAVPPVIALEASKVVANVSESIVLRASSDILATFEWDLGDGGNAMGAVVEHSYDREGDYTVVLLAQGETGSSITKVAIRIVDRPPVGGFGVPSRIVVGMPVAFEDSVVDPEGGPVSVSWSFGDGGASDEKTPSYAFREVGTFMVRRSAIDQAGKTLESTVEVVVEGRPNRAPVADFAFDIAEPTAGDAVRFLSRALDEDGILRSWTWNVDGAPVGDGPSLIHVFNAGGSYTVRLDVADDQRASANVSKIIIVQDARLEFRIIALPLDPRAGETVQLSVESSQDLVLYEWVLPGGRASRSATASFVPDAKGEYAVSLLATAANGLVQEATARIFVEETALESASVGSQETPGLGVALGALGVMLTALVRRRG